MESNEFNPRSLSTRVKTITSKINRSYASYRECACSREQLQLDGQAKNWTKSGTNGTTLAYKPSSECLWRECITHGVLAEQSRAIQMQEFAHFLHLGENGDAGTFPGAVHFTPVVCIRLLNKSPACVGGRELLPIVRTIGFLVYSAIFAVPFFLRATHVLDTVTYFDDD